MTKAFLSKSLVLYADDDSDDIELIQDAFRAYAHNVELVVFRNGLELLDYLKEIRPYQPNPCLIILDINMPILDGKDTLKRIR
ncbi:MAG TPA: response regulator, partial [Flavisolibacter sp.]|nr:response regulator [Flavisolibacter sp.]